MDHGCKCDKGDTCDCGQVDYSRLTKAGTDTDVYYIDSDRVLQGPRMMYCDATKKWLSDCLCYRNGIQTGHEITWDCTKHIKSTEGYYNEHGKSEGLTTVWYALHDTIMQQGYMKDGKKEGHWIYNYLDGKRCTDEYYKDGKETGHWIFYKEDGTVDHTHDF